MRPGSSLTGGGAESTSRVVGSAAGDPASQYAAASPTASPAPTKTTVLNIPASVSGRRRLLRAACGTTIVAV